jgi:hypothetical protein
MAAAHVTMWSYVWDFAHDGIEETLKYLKEEVGLTAVSVATSYHTVEHLRPHGKGPFIFRSRGALYFTPDSRRYPKTSIRPPVSPLVREFGNPLRKIADTCRKLGLDLVSWTVCCHNSNLGETHPERTVRNCFGDSYPEALCPANPDVRAYLAGLVDDLSANYGISLAELESCHYPAKRHYHHHEKISILFGELEEFLLALCFCPHCSERARAAGLDVNGMKARVVGTLRHVFETGEPEKQTLAEYLASFPELRQFTRVRVETVTSLLREMKSRSRAPLSAMSWASAEECGLDVKQAIGAAESITVLAYSPDVEEVRRIIREAAVPAGGAGRLRAGYHTYPPNTPDRETLLRNIRASLDLEVRGFSFYNYGIMPRRSLAWAREAVAMIRGA